MEHLLFTYPACPKCEALKKFLKEKNLGVQEYNLVLKESKLKIRDFLKVLKRDDKGAIIIPTLILKDGGEVVGVFNKPEDLDEWLKLRA